MKLKFIIAFLLIVESFTAIAEMDIKEGNWEITTQMQMQGMPVKVGIPPVTINQCFTKENMTPEKMLNNKHCEMLAMDIGEKTVSWKMKCKQIGMKMEGHGNLAYNKTSFDGTFKMLMSGSKQGDMNINTKLNGHYVGPCKK
jgi:hypothetical protein